MQKFDRFLHNRIAHYECSGKEIINLKWKEACRVETDDKIKLRITEPPRTFSGGEA